VRLRAGNILPLVHEDVVPQRGNRVVPAEICSGDVRIGSTADIDRIEGNHRGIIRIAVIVKAAIRSLWLTNITQNDEVVDDRLNRVVYCR
jgi:hypothetical protein